MSDICWVRIWIVWFETPLLADEAAPLLPPEPPRTRRPAPAVEDDVEAIGARRAAVDADLVVLAAPGAREDPDPVDEGVIPRLPSQSITG